MHLIVIIIGIIIFITIIIIIIIITIIIIIIIIIISLTSDFVPLTPSGVTNQQVPPGPPSEYQGGAWLFIKPNLMLGKQLALIYDTE